MKYKLKIKIFNDGHPGTYITNNYLYYDIKYYGRKWGKYEYEVTTNDDPLPTSFTLVVTLDNIEFYDPEVWKKFKIIEEKMDTVKDIIE